MVSSFLSLAINSARSAQKLPKYGSSDRSNVKGSCGPRYVLIRPFDEDAAKKSFKASSFVNLRSLSTWTRRHTTVCSVLKLPAERSMFHKTDLWSGVNVNGSVIEKGNTDTKNEYVNCLTRKLTCVNSTSKPFKR